MDDSLWPFEAQLRIAQRLDRIHTQMMGELTTFDLWNMPADRRAAVIGAVEACWTAFAARVTKELGIGHTPVSILAMDSSAQEIARKAYDAAYAKEVAQIVEGR